MKNKNIFKGIGFMMSAANRAAKIIYFYLICDVILFVLHNLLTVFILPTVLSLVIVGADFGTIFEYILLFSAGIMVTSGLIEYIKSVWEFPKIEIRTHIINMVLKKSCDTSYENLDKPEFKNLRDRSFELNSDNSSATEAFWQTVSNILKYFVGFMVYLVFLARLNIILVLMTIAASLISFACVMYANRWKNNNRVAQAVLSKKLSCMTSLAMNNEPAKEIRLFGLENNIKDLYAKLIHLKNIKNNDEERRYLFAAVTDTIVTSLRNIYIFYFLGKEVLTGNTDAGLFLLYYAQVNTFTAWLTGILENCSTLSRQCDEIETMTSFLEFKEPFRFTCGRAIPVKDKNIIELKNVSFRYKGSDKNILNNICLKLNENEKLALVGLNGAGKTTLIKLIIGLYDPTEGEVLFNGVNIKEFNREEYYDLFGAIFQDFKRLPLSVKVNIIQNKPLDEARLNEVIKLSGIDNTISKLKHGVDTVLGKEVYTDGVELSGGELQRVMIARTIYKRPKILLLDEPTAALDPIKEKEIYEKYHELSNDSSSVFISHRLASTRFCDRIILLEDGKIIEEGTHDELLAQNGSYAELFNVQKKYYGEAQNETIA